LTAGDVVQIGDIRFNVSVDDGVWTITERREQKQEQDIDAVVGEQLTKLQTDKNMPTFFLLSAVLCGVILVLFLAVPPAMNSWRSWSSGPISNNHLMIANQCSSCHEAPFRPVKDESCTACHAMTDHAPVFGPALIEKHKDLKMGCASCHMEHNGTTGLIVRNSALCTNCHGDIKRLIPEAQAQNVPRFDKHPEFTVMIQPPIPGGAYTRVRLDDPANLKDNSNVKLNHQKHLATLNGPKGKVKLECRSCHEPSDDLRTIKPISYDKHCQECHGLEFDDRLKGRQVPHGSADVVYRYLYAEYAKLALSQTPEDKPIQEVFNLRGRPGSVMPSVAAQPKQGEDFTRAFVEKESRDSERKLFTKTACFLCHRVAPKEITPEEAASKQTGLFTVLQPDIPNRWMPHSIFSHGAHEAVKCEECHHGVSESNRTQDVLMPKVGDCTGCHSEEGDHGTVKSDCVMCHSFHDQLTVPEDRKRQIDKILAAVH